MKNLVTKDQESKKELEVVCGIILNDKQEVLLAKRSLSKKIAPGKYHLPGGHVELGESMQDALVRELNEELNLEVCVDSEVGKFTYENTDSFTYGTAFKVSVKDFSTLKFDIGDISEIVWCKFSDIERFLSKKDHNYMIIKNFYETR